LYIRYVTVRYGSKRTDQRYVTLRYGFLRYVTLREGGKQALVMKRQKAPYVGETMYVRVVSDRAVMM